MSEPYVFKLAAQRSDWLSTRQTLIAGNVANANTPGYRATDLQPFASVLDATQVSMTTTNPMHMAPTDQELTAAHVVETEPSDETMSGNTVRLENEMIKLGDVNRDYTMGTNLKRVLHQMMMSVLK